MVISACSGSVINRDDEEARKAITRSVKLYSSENWETRKDAVSNAAGYSNSTYSKNVLLLMMKAADDPIPLVRIEALNGLKKLRSGLAVYKIRYMAVSDNDTMVRWTALLALGEYGLPLNEDIFVKCFNDRDWLIREASINGLLKIEGTDVQQRNVELVISAIKDESISVKIAALENIRYKDTRLLPVISGIINNPSTGTSLLKSALVAASGFKFDDTTRKKLFRLLTHPDRDIRILAFRALKKEEELNNF